MRTLLLGSALAAGVVTLCSSTADAAFRRISSSGCGGEGNAYTMLANGEENVDQVWIGWGASTMTVGSMNAGVTNGIALSCPVDYDATFTDSQVSILSVDATINYVQSNSGAQLEAMPCVKYWEGTGFSCAPTITSNLTAGTTGYHQFLWENETVFNDPSNVDYAFVFLKLIGQPGTSSQFDQVTINGIYVQN